MEDFIPIIIFVAVTVVSVVASAYQKKRSVKGGLRPRPRRQPEPRRPAEPYVVVEPEPEPRPEPALPPRPVLRRKSVLDVDDAIDVDHADERIDSAVDAAVGDGIDAVNEQIEKTVFSRADAMGLRAEALGGLRETTAMKAYALPRKGRTGWTGGQLRQAVVMAEVLGKPVSRRPRNLRGRPRSGVHLDFGGTGQGARGTGW